MPPVGSVVLFLHNHQPKLGVVRGYSHLDRITIDGLKYRRKHDNNSSLGPFYKAEPTGFRRHLQQKEILLVVAESLGKLPTC